MKEKRTDLPLIGFISFFEDVGETYPYVAIAKKYIELGGKAIFFGYGKKYQHLAKEIGCEIIDLTVDFSENALKRARIVENKIVEQQLPIENFYSDMVHEDFYQFDIDTIKKEVKAFEDTDVKLIVTGFDFLTKISARIANIPLIYIVSGSSIPPYYQQNLASFPDNYENFFLRLVPGFIKNRLANWYILNNKSSVKGFNRRADTFDTPRINHLLDLGLADYTLVADDIAILNVKPTDEFPAKNFVGPILPDNIYTKKGEQLDQDIEQHLKRPGKKILLTMGSLPICKKLFLRILKILEQTDYNVIATYTNILNDEEIPKLNENILLKKFVPSISKLSRMVDLAIISGGRGTVYTAAYSGKPAIGIPLHIEQQCNIDNLVRHGSTIRLSKRNFTEKKLLKTINTIFTNYDTFLKNAQILKAKLKEPKGAENTAKRLIEIIEKERI